MNNECQESLIESGGIVYFDVNLGAGAYDAIIVTQDHKDGYLLLSIQSYYVPYGLELTSYTFNDDLTTLTITLYVRNYYTEAIYVTGCIIAPLWIKSSIL